MKRMGVGILAAAIACTCLAAGAQAAQPRYRVAWATFLGGREWDQAREVIVYPDGSTLVGGQTMSSDFPATAGAVQPRYAGDDPALGHGGVIGGDCFLARLAADGSKILAATFFGGSKQERNVYGMALDRRGDIVICSATRSPDVPTTAGCFQPKYGGPPSDWMVAKISADLAKCLWCTYVGGSGDDFPRGGLALDAEDNVLVIGESHSPDFPTTPGAFQRSLKGPQDAAIVKLRADGSGLAWATRLGGSATEGSIGVCVDKSGYVYATGHTRSADFPVTAGAAQARLAGESDCWLAKFPPDASRLLYATFLGGSQNEFGEHRAHLCADGALVLTGFAGSHDFPTTPGAVRAAAVGKSAGFLAKLAPDGRQFVFSALVGGSGGGFWLMPTPDKDGNIFIVGETSSPDLPVTPDALQPRFGSGPGDGAVAVISPDGSRVLYCSYLGGGGEDMIRAVALGPAGEVYLVGHTASPEFPATPGAAQPKLAGGKADAFVLKLVPAR
ncbi:MAG: hypothetical protein FJ288_12475 [Planctomycetes bacterium]|nr:hypothetical protein [Planctomycetota bacterium]